MSFYSQQILQEILALIDKINNAIDTNNYQEGIDELLDNQLRGYFRISHKYCSCEHEFGELNNILLPHPYPSKQEVDRMVAEARHAFTKPSSDCNTYDLKIANMVYALWTKFNLVRWNITKTSLGY